LIVLKIEMLTKKLWVQFLEESKREMVVTTIEQIVKAIEPRSRKKETIRDDVKISSWLKVQALSG